jgi:prepilin-type processing-associated H-X9-DG protein
MSTHLKRLFLVGLVGVVLAALTMGSSGAFAAGSPRVVATFSVHPVPGSGPSAGGGGVLFADGSVSGLISIVDLADDETIHAIPLSWKQFLSTNEVEICFEFIVVRGEAELPPGTVLCIRFPVGQSVVALENVVVTVRLIHRR